MAASPIWKSAAWAALTAHVPEIERTHLRDLLADPARCAALTAEFDGTLLDYSRQRVTLDTMRLLHSLASEAGLSDRIRAMATGERINTTEGRAVLHMALRAPRGAPPLVVDGVDVHAQVHGVRDRIAAFVERVRSGAHVGATGKPLTSVVSIGIGGRWDGPLFFPLAFWRVTYALPPPPPPPPSAATLVWSMCTRRSATSPPAARQAAAGSCASSQTWIPRMPRAPLTGLTPRPPSLW